MILKNGFDIDPKREIQVLNPVTGEVRTELRRRPRVYADLDYENTEVQQSFKDEVNINFIMKRYQEKGILPDMIKRDPTYGDFTQVPTFQESLEIVNKAREQFDGLPASVRKRFGNDPAQFLDFVNKPENASELVKMGLANERKPEPIPEPQKVIIVNPDANGGVDDEGAKAPKSKK